MVVEWLSVVAAGPGPPQPDPGASGEPVRRLHYPAGSVLVVAGIPGAGKTTLIERLFTGGAVTVLDSDTVRRRYARAGRAGPVPAVPPTGPPRALRADRAGAVPAG